MKSRAALIMIVLFPYLAIALIVISLMGLMNFQDPRIQSFLFFIPLIFFFLYLLLLVGSLGLVLSAMYRNFREYRDPRGLLLHTLIIKLLHLPSYGILVFMSAAAMNPFLMILIPIFMITAVSAMIFGGLIGICTMQAARSEGVISLSQAILFSILQFIPGVDILSGIFLMIRLRGSSERID